MQRSDAPSPEALKYGTAGDPGARESFALVIACLGIGICAAAYMGVFLWLPRAIAALNLPAFVIIFSLPLACLIALVAGIVSTVARRRSRLHRRLGLVAASINYLVAGYGIFKLAGVLIEFNRAWAPHGMGP